MKYNLTGNITNSGDEVTFLDAESLGKLTDGERHLQSVDLSPGDTAELIVDLGNRFDLDRIDYYYIGSSSISISVAESFDVWHALSLSTIVSGTTASIENYNPRWVRVTHQSPGSSSSIFEVEVYNNDSNILFGHYGDFSIYSMDYTGSVVQEISLYNPTNQEKDIKVFIEDDNSSVADEAVGISISQFGPFTYKRDKGVSLPSSFSWTSGSLDNLTVSGTFLCLDPPNISGSYYSPVFYTGLYDNIRFYWSASVPEGGKIDFLSSVDSEESFGVRRSNIPPSNPWSDGQLAEHDSLWSTSSGSLLFEPVPNNSILELRDRDYLQFTVTITGSYLFSPCLLSAGVEDALVVSGVPSQSYKDFYVLVSSGTDTQTAGLICWYEE
jgi:hypothetical protein